MAFFLFNWIVLKYKYMKKYIAIAGNIGAGKSNLANKLADHFGFELFQEPFKINPYLEQFYKDMKTWAFRTELAFLSHRLQDHLSLLDREHSVIQDRCLYEGAEVFVKNLYVTDNLSEHDWQTYNHLYENIKKHIAPPDLMVYIKSSVDRCMNNIQNRGRDLDKNIERDYLVGLDDLYRNWHQEFSLCPVVVADADENDFKYNESDFQGLVREIDRLLITN